MILQSEFEHEDIAWGLNWSKTNAQLVSCSSDKTIKIYSETKLLQTIDDAHSRTIRSVSFNPNGKLIASCSFDATTSIWEDGEAIATLQGHENEVKAVDWSASGELLATCSRDKSVWIWELLGEGDLECVAVLQEHTQDVKFIKWHPTEEVL